MVIQEEGPTASPSQIPDPDERSERSPTPDFVEEVLFGSEREDSLSNNMLVSTCLKYSRFQGDGSQDVDDWFCEFGSIALVNQEDLEVKQRIFQGLLKGEALKWYQDILDQNRNEWDEFISLFLRTF